MENTVTGILVTIGLFAAILTLLNGGFSLGRKLNRGSEGPRPGLATLETAIFGLAALLFAFSFSNAASRFDARRQLIIEEANAIGTAYLRIAILPESDQPAMRERFRAYLDARLKVYQSIGSDFKAGREATERAQALQGEIWSQSVAACRADTVQPIMLLVLPSLNQMFDIATSRDNHARMHPPFVIFVLLAILMLICSLLAGLGMAASSQKSWPHMVIFAVAVCVTIYVILELQYPRLGIVRIDRADRVLLDLRASMK